VGDSLVWFGVPGIVCSAEVSGNIIVRKIGDLWLAWSDVRRHNADTGCDLEKQILKKLIPERNTP
jgi:hypothetical protein